MLLVENPKTVLAGVKVVGTKGFKLVVFNFVLTVSI